ncbi:MAG: uroporphyrinogen-III synthase [Pseudomonadota bacterium]
MSAAIIAIRPEPGLSSTIAVGKAHGLDIIGLPLSQTEPVGWELPDLTGVDALLVGSANVFRHGGEALGELTHLPVHAVGEATAEAARETGFQVAAIGQGGLQNLLNSADPAPNHFLRLAGEERISLKPPESTAITEKVVYRVRNLPLNATQAALFATPAMVLLHSASSAAHFAKECKRLGLDRPRISLAALGPRILAAAGAGWAEARAAAAPADSELLALAQDMWQRH